MSKCDFVEGKPVAACCFSILVHKSTASGRAAKRSGESANCRHSLGSALQTMPTLPRATLQKKVCVVLASALASVCLIEMWTFRHPVLCTTPPAQGRRTLSFLPVVFFDGARIASVETCSQVVRYAQSRSCCGPELTSMSVDRLGRKDG